MRAFIAFSQVRMALLAALLATLLAGACGGEDEAAAACPAVGASTYTPVAFATQDGVTLCGRLYGAGQPSVVLSHMQPTDQESWAGFAETAAREGYTALTFNFRGYDPSGGDREISKLDVDVEAAVDFSAGPGRQGNLPDRREHGGRGVGQVRVAGGSAGRGGAVRADGVRGDGNPGGMREGS